MTADEYRNALSKWKLKHKAAADFFSITVITSQRYATGERQVPPPMAMLIHLMLVMKLDPPKVREWLADAQPSPWPKP